MSTKASTPTPEVTLGRHALQVDLGRGGVFFQVSADVTAPWAEKAKADYDAQHQVRVDAALQAAAETFWTTDPNAIEYQNLLDSYRRQLKRKKQTEHRATGAEQKAKEQGAAGGD